MLEGGRHLEALHLRIGEGLVDAVDGAAGYALGRHRLHDVRGGALASAASQKLVQRIAIG